MSMVDQKGYDWSARVRTTASEALRYSRFVTVMKKVLSAGAFLIIFAVLAFFFIQRQPRGLQLAYEKLGMVQNDLAMMKPKLTGTDSKGRHSAASDTAEIPSRSADRIHRPFLSVGRRWVDV